MSIDTQELIRICQQLPDAKRDAVADFARFLLAWEASEGNLLDSGSINRTPGVVGGDARIRDTRIPVWTLVQLKKLGRSEVDLVADFPGLTAADLQAAWDYYRQHTHEIDQAIADEEAEA